MKVLAAVVVLTVAAAVTPAEHFTCQHTIHCPCGRTGKNVTICSQKGRKDDPCSRWSKCKTCQEGLHRCLECPEGLEGPLCSTELGREKFSRQKRQYHIHYGKRPRRPNSPYQQRPNQAASVRASSIMLGGSFCPEIKSPKLGSIRCMSDDRLRTCVGRCLPGYSFENRGSEDEITLTCTGGYYTPLREFPPCKYVHDRTCSCEYGGSCNIKGECVCPVGRTGRFCETIVHEKHTCNDPGFVTNGFRRNADETDASSRRTFEEGESVVYGCVSEEHALQGSSLLTCKNDGTWSKAVPKCIRTTTSPDRSLTFCRDPGVDPNGSRRPRTAPNRRGFPQGTRLEYSCNQGYDLDGEKSVFCLTSGEWSSGRPRCNSQFREPGPDSSLTFCPDPGVDPNGSRNPRSPPNRRGFPQGTRLEYSCNQGYHLDGERSLFCLVSGEWLSRRPKCNAETREPEIELVYCLNPGSISNGRMVYYPPLSNRRRVQPEVTLDEPEYPQGGRIQYSCDNGYTLEGSESVICQRNRVWSPKPPVCRRTVAIRMIYCDNPGPIPNGKVVHVPTLNERRSRPSDLDDEGYVEYPQGSRLYYSCDNGYSLQGTSNLTCESSGLWSADPPACITSDVKHILYCINPGPVLNGRIRYYSPIARPRTGSTNLVSEDTPEYPEGTRLEYQCDEGYITEGYLSLTCLSTGIWSALPPKCVADCGRSVMGTTRRILHGNKTVAGEWPWVVALTVGERNFTRIICGGAILNTQTIITAAHCLDGVSRLTLYFGKFHRRNSLDDTQVLIATSDRMIVHPDFNKDSMDSDIALITFKPKIKFSERVQPICLPSAESTAMNLVTGRRGYVTGWGYTEKRLGSDELLMAHLPFITNSACLQSFRENVPDFNPVLTQNMFCAGFPDAKQSTCRGDSGSPIVFYDAITERYTLEGVVSFGVEGQCGLPGRYSVFTKVYRFLPWIYRNI